MIKATAAFSLLFLTGQTAFAAKKLLTPSDFVYMGVSKIPSGFMGQFGSGLAYNPHTNTYFSISNNGSRPFRLKEYSLPAPNPNLAKAGSAVLVKDWGAIDPDGTKLPGPTETSMASGLYFDPSTNKLWLTYGNWYNVSGKNYPCIFYLTLDTGAIDVHGPWLVPDKVHSGYVALGSFFPLPDYLQSILGMQWGAAAPNTSGGNGSWGDGLVAIQDPSSLPAATTDETTWPAATTPAAKLINWPEITTTTSSYVYSYSDFPREPITKLFGGNGLVIGGLRTRTGQRDAGKMQAATATTVTLDATTPVSGAESVVPGLYIILGKTQLPSGYPPAGKTYLITAVDSSTPTAIVATIDPPWDTTPSSGDPYIMYDPNTTPTVFVPSTNFQQGDGGFMTHHGAWVETADKYGYVETNLFSSGYVWYANADSFCDPTPAGVTYNADIDSTLYPGQKVINYGGFGLHGNMAEAWVPHLFISDPAAIIDIAHKVASGTVIPSDLKLIPASTAYLTTLGGAVQTGDATGRGNAAFKLQEQYFNPDTRTLYILVNGVADGPEPSVQVWQVGGSTALSIITPSPLPSGTLGLSYNETFSASGGTTPYTWSVIGSTPVPAGLSLSTGGVLSGTPTIPGTSIFTIQVKDAAGTAASKNFSLPVNPDAPPFIVTPAAATPNPVVGATTNLLVAANDDGGEPSLIYTWASTGTAPAAVSFSTNSTNAAKNTVATFIKAGAYTIQVTAKDTAGLTAISSTTVTVSQTLTSVQLAPSSATVSVGGAQQFTAIAKDQNGDPISGVSFMFTSTNTSVAVVSSTGLARGLSLGSAGIYASSGAVTSNMALLTVAGDTAPPTVAITAPPNGATVSGAVTIAGTAADNVAVAKVEVAVDSGAYALAMGTATWNYSLNTLLLSNATHTLTARATDTSGNTATSAISVSVSNGGGGPGSVVVGPGGATIIFYFNSGGKTATITLIIPPGAFSSPSTLTLNMPSIPLSGSALGAMAGMQHSGIGLEIISSLQPDKNYPSTIMVSQVSGVDMNKPSLMAWLDPASGHWVPLPSRQQTKEVTANTTHFTVFALMQVSAAADLDSAKVFPNPFRPTQGHTFVAFTNLPADARVRIYTLVGEKVRELSADSTGMAVWDGNNDAGAHAASGVYFALLQGNGQKKILKVAVQR